LLPISSQSNSASFDDELSIKMQVDDIKYLLDLPNNSKVLFLDFFVPGLDALKYLTEINNKNLKLGALIHGGSFYPKDLCNWSWLKELEKCWFEIFDELYVPSNYAKSFIPQLYKSKIKVFPWGIDHLDFSEKVCKKTKDIIFPHRLELDKGVDEFIEIVKKLSDVNFTVTIPTRNVKNKYYLELKSLNNVDIVIGESDSKHLKTIAKHRIVLSCSYQELFGFGIIKAVNLNCIPLLPNRAVYPEFFIEEFLYEKKDIVSLIHSLINNNKKYNKYFKLLEENIYIFDNMKCINILKDFYSK
jgi:glycosyltransferase involved in cell wall biosynthesis